MGGDVLEPVPQLIRVGAPLELKRARLRFRRLAADVAAAAGASTLVVVVHPLCVEPDRRAAGAHGRRRQRARARRAAVDGVAREGRVRVVVGEVDLSPPPPRRRVRGRRAEAAATATTATTAARAPATPIRHPHARTRRSTSDAPTNRPTR